MDLFRVLILTASALPLALFAFYYVTEPVPGKRRRRYSRIWLSTPLGPAWLGQKLAMLAMIVSIIAFFLFGEYPFRRQITDFIYVVLVGLFWAHFFVLRRVQKTGRSNPKEEQ